MARLTVLGGPILGAPVLLLRQRDARHLRSGNLGEVEREAAPAAADVEDAGARAQAKFRREMPPLGELRIVERLLVRLEVGTAVLLVAVEEQPVKPAVEIVVVCDIAASAAPRIEVLQTPERVAQKPARREPTRHGNLLVIEQDRQHVGDRAALDDKSAVQVGFAELQFGIEQCRALRRRRGKAHRRGRAGSVAEGVSSPRSRGYRKRPTADQLVEKHRQQPMQGRLHALHRAATPDGDCTPIAAGRRTAPSTIAGRASLAVTSLAVIKTKSSLTSNAPIVFSIREPSSPKADFGIE